MNQNKESFPELTREPGAIHPITQIKSEILSLLEQIGFAFIDGPEVETEKYNFDIIILSNYHIRILSYCHLATCSCYHMVIVSNYHITILSENQIIRLSYYHIR